MRRTILAAVLWIVLLASCGPQPAPVSTSHPPTPAQIPHAPEIRFALVGQLTDVNVWALFDEEGASYANYALRSDYWPRLYYLAPPELVFTPRAASGLPSPVTQEGEFFTSAVTLRSDLNWTDGSPFTAEDVAFTINAALLFELGFDWQTYYSPEYLARAEAVDSTTVKYYFKRRPNVAIWQYGALQGPVVQKAYWEPKIADAKTLLPDETLRASIADAQARIAKLQPIVNDLNAKFYALQASGKTDQELEAALKRNQGDLDHANNDLTKFLAEYSSKVEAAHRALYALNNANEPTLGVWMPAAQQDGKWVNAANPDFPFETPNFDRAVYFSFASEEAAVEAFENGEVDLILPATDSLFSMSDQHNTSPHLNGTARFLVFNRDNPALDDPALRQALACMIRSPGRSTSASIGGFVLPGNEFWRNPEAVAPCADLTDANLDLRVERAVDILKSAGYSWSVEPAPDVSGEGAVAPNGSPLSAFTLLSLSADYDALQAEEAAFIEGQAKRLGISVAVEYVSPQDIRYRVFSSGEYDMAILGWRLSLYPGYLCEWFGAQGQFDDGEGGLRSECEALESESDLDAARRRIFQIQSILARELPFIPLYAGVSYEAYRNIDYPFETALGGFTGLYGAPSYAIPSP